MLRSSVNGVVGKEHSASKLISQHTDLARSFRLHTGSLLSSPSVLTWETYACLFACINKHLHIFFHVATYTKDKYYYLIFRRKIFFVCFYATAGAYIYVCFYVAIYIHASLFLPCNILSYTSIFTRQHTLTHTYICLVSC